MTEKARKQKVSNVVFNKVLNTNRKVITKAEIVFMVLCFFTSRNSIGGELFPFAISFICAYFVLYGKSIVILGISILGIISAQGHPSYILVLLFLYSYFLKDKKGEKNIVYIAILASSILFLTKVALIFLEGFMIDRLFVSIFESTLVFSSAYILSKGLKSFDIVGYIKKDGEKIICFSVTILLSIMGLNKIYVGNVSVFKIAQYSIIPFCSCYFGPAAGALTGFVFGFINGTTLIETAYYTASLSLGGVLAGILSERYKIYGTVIFPIVSAGALYYFGAVRIFKGDIIELASGFIFCLAIVFLNDRKIRKFLNKEKTESKVNNTYNKLTKLSNAIEEICTAYQEGLGKQNNRVVKEIEEIVSDVYGEECIYCSQHNICWKSNFNRTYYNIVKIVRSINEGRNILKGDYLNKIKCIKYNNLIRTIHNISTELEVNEIRQNEISKSKETIVNQLLETTGIINSTAEEIKYINIRDKKAINFICKALNETNINIKHFNILGKNKDVFISVTLSTEKNIDKVVKNIIDVIYHVTGTKVHCSEKIVTIDNYYIAKFMNKKKLDAKTYYSRISKENSRISGDSFTYGSTENKYYMILSDGMGSGVKALNESKSTVDILSKLTEANFDEKQLLKTMNSLLMLKFEDERYTTIDLIILDLIEYEARFYKAGAATTFIIKSNEITTIDSNSLPAGILEDIKYQFNRSKVNSGDIIVMVTDGIIDSINVHEKDSLENYLKKIKNEDPQTIANLILTHAMRGCKDIIDDMTVLVTKIV